MIYKLKIRTTELLVPECFPCDVDTQSTPGLHDPRRHTVWPLCLHPTPK